MHVYFNCTITIFKVIKQHKSITDTKTTLFSCLLSLSLSSAKLRQLLNDPDTEVNRLSERSRVVMLGCKLRTVDMHKVNG